MKVAFFVFILFASKATGFPIVPRAGGDEHQLNEEFQVEFPMILPNYDDHVDYQRGQTKQLEGFGEILRELKYFHRLFGVQN